MSVEMVLKYKNAVSRNYFKLQHDWKNKADGTFGSFDGKVIAGFKFKHRFNLQRGENFPLASLFRTVDRELAAGRKVIVSLPSGDRLWHMYVIDRPIGKDEYMAYSRAFNQDRVLVKNNVKRAIRACKGTDILTYQ